MLAKDLIVISTEPIDVNDSIEYIVEYICVLQDDTRISHRQRLAGSQDSLVRQMIECADECQRTCDKKMDFEKEQEVADPILPTGCIMNLVRALDGNS